MLKGSRSATKFLQALACAFVLGAVAGCAAAVDSESQAALKRGLLALDSGDDAAAKHALEESLRADPHNAKARTALASIEAKKAGVQLKDWLDPMLEAGKQMDSKLKAYRQSAETAASVSGEEAPRAERETALETRAAAGLEQNKLKKRILKVHRNLGQAAVGAIILVDTFHGIPYLDEEQMRSLDQAIHILREDNEDPAKRSDEVKVYLSVLSIVRFVHFSRAFLGTSPAGSGALLSNQSYFCQASEAEAKIKVGAMRDSLVVLEESLRFTEEPKDGPQKARYNIHRFIKKVLLKKEWEKAELFFQKDTAENLAVKRIFNRICGASGGPAAVGGADLFDPDEE